MSNVEPLDGQYPNEFLGFSAYSDAEAGAVNNSESPVRLATAAGVTGVILNSGTGAPACGGNVGDAYFDKAGGDGTWIYRCTVAGTAGNATWVAKL